jgi:hypothetical protein
MSQKNRVHLKALVAFIFMGLFLGAFFGVIIYFGVAELSRDIQPILSAQQESLPQNNAWQLVTTYQPLFWYTVFPGILIFSLLSAIIFWLFVRPGLKKVSAPGKLPKPVQKKDSQERNLSDRRLFLHIFSAMQRDGRLMDFLSEDLDQYEDAQIGSAVRNIHAGCKQVVNKYLNPEPVMAEAEGEKTTVPEDFDPGLITLTGKVVGDPPFTGIIRHKGWQTGDMKLPKLSGRQNASVIAPAEIEIT